MTGSVRDKANAGAVTDAWRFDLADAMHSTLRRSGIGVQEMADYLGVNRSTVSTWINGRIVPGKPALRAWALRTGVSYEWLCAVRDSNPEPADLWLVAA